ncbi:MAG: hypothetical protein U9N87_05485 [Planctomycetota bacterium]|nr:hypothetical protein [Planctomycetota bacterium]
MRSCIYIIMSVVLALASVPHLMCACGCSIAKTTDVAGCQTPPYCPHCPMHSPADNSNQTPQRPHPCECGNCDRILAAVPSHVVAVAASGGEICPHIVADTASVQPATQQLLTESRGTGPPGQTSHPSIAIPILLGHLLL